MAAQLALIDGFYRCHNCKRDVDQVQRTRRFWLCCTCFGAIVPTFEGTVDHGSPEQAQIMRYWEWYNRMERKFPAGRVWRPRPKPFQPARSIDSFWPYCECGRERKEYNFGTERSLFGGARSQYCVICEAKKTVEHVAGMADAIHPDWDDETWLDLLWKSHREAFDLGVLPDYWFELRRLEIPGTNR